MKNIVLRDNKTGEKMTLTGVSILQTNDTVGLPIDWVPDDEVSSLAEVDIVENGDYSAARFGAYGIGVARVNVNLYALRTVGNFTYRIYKDNRGKPHISVSRKIT